MQTRAVARRAGFASLLALAFLPGSALADSGIPALTQAYNASGQALFADLARRPGNIVISPYSIGTAMAMARSGARGETERQMTSVLKHGLPPAATDAANAALLAILNATGKAAGSEPSVRLTAANALMLTPGRGRLISAEFKALVSDKYGAAVHEGAGLDTVNAWVREKTQGRIDRILDKLDGETAAVLLNAVYLKASWASAFPRTATREDDFHLSSTDKVRVPTMRQQAPLALTQGAGYRAIRLDYVGRALAMVVVLPDEVEGLGAVSRKLDAAGFARLAAGLKKREPSRVALALPRFKAEFKASLVPLFQRAGITLAFDPKVADFSGMTGKRADGQRLNIDDIQHRAVIEVTEPGTEAAAATSVAMVARAMHSAEPPNATPFIVDRPFLFYVVDDASGAILFQGRIADPR